MRFNLVFLFLVTTFISMYASITGKVVDDKQQGIEGAVVTLLAPADSTYVASTVANKAGEFDFKDVDADAQYIVRAECYGYVPVTTLYQGQSLSIVLKANTNDLKEVMVTAQKPGTLKSEGNKFIYVPDALPGEVKHAYDVLGIIPLVDLSPQGVLSMVGKHGCMLYVNGRPPRQGEEILMQYLHFCDPKVIKKVELIMNPDFSAGSSYMGGIINLIMDEPDWGWIGSVSANARYNLLNNVSVAPTGYVSYTRDRLSVSAYANYDFARDNERTLTEYFYTSGDEYSITNDMRYKRKQQSLSGNLAIGYKPTYKSEVGLKANVGWSDYDSYRITKELDSQDELPTEFRNVSNSKNHPNFGLTAYYYIETDSRKSNLDINVYGGIQQQGSIGTDYFPTKTAIEDNTIKPKVAGASAKYLQNFADGSYLSGGATWNYQNVSNLRLRNDITDEFLYRKSQTSFYVNYNRNWTSQLGMMIALNLENHHINGDQTTMNHKFKTNEWNLSPRVSLSYSFPQGQQNIILSYTNFITSPAYLQLNPFRTWSSSTTYHCGNPDLKIDKHHMVSLSYAFLNHFYLGLTYMYSPNPVKDYTFTDDEGNTVTSYANLGKDHMIGPSAQFYTTVSNFIRLNFKVELWYRNQKAWINGANLGYSNLGGRAVQDIRFVWSKPNINFSLSNIVYAPSRSVTSNNKKWSDYTTVSINKEFGAVASLGLTVSNIFNIKHDGYFWTPEYARRTHSFSPGTSMWLNFVYRFGNLQARENRSSRYAIPDM